VQSRTRLGRQQGVNQGGSQNHNHTKERFTQEPEGEGSKWKLGGGPEGEFWKEGLGLF
jgi:hypothetical protein